MSSSRQGRAATPAKGNRDAVTVKEPKGSGRTGRVKFGLVTVAGKKPTKAQLKANVEFSTHALDRFSKKISKAGVRIRAKRDVPLFFADSQNPDRVIRKLNGHTESGVFEDGVFKVVD